MADTKENILHTALRLFARDGYEAASVSDMAQELGMTKGALYKHYKNKQDILDSIVQRIYQLDVDNAKRYEVPEEIYEQAPSAYDHMDIYKLKGFIEAQYRFWTEDEFSSNFRKMLTLEQYRNPELMDLYQKCLVSGPVSYIEDLFREMMEQKEGAWSKCSPKQLALEFYAPFYLLVSFSDITSHKDEAAKLLSAHIERFIDQYFVPKKQKEE